MPTASQSPRHHRRRRRHHWKQEHVAGERLPSPLFDLLGRQQRRQRGRRRRRDGDYGKDAFDGTSFVAGDVRGSERAARCGLACPMPLRDRCATSPPQVPLPAVGEWSSGSGVASRQLVPAAVYSGSGLRPWCARKRHGVFEDPER